MTPGLGFDLHPEAAQDIADIGNRSPPIVRKRQSAFAKKSWTRFAAFPHQAPDLSNRPLRFKVVRDYLIAYAPDERPLWVIAVMHGRHSPRVMAAILRGRER